MKPYNEFKDNGHKDQAVPLVEITRGPVVERTHYGHVVLVDEKGEILFALGNPFKYTYMRSCAKPVQVLPLLLAKADRYFGFTPAEIAIMCASHYCEPNHMETLVGIMKKASLDESMLLCGSSISLKLEQALDLAAHHVKLTSLYNDCSGKHLGMLALCRFKNYPVKDYILPTHPLQQEILNTFADFCHIHLEDVTIGIDGCSAPVFALPLYHMARAYVQLACPGLFKPMYQEACDQVFQAMTAHPLMISGSGGFCSQLIAAANGKLIGKVGADGVYCVGIKGKNLGLAVKIEDGNMGPLPTVVLEILDRFDVFTEQEKKQLEFFHTREVLNDRQVVVGYQRACF